MSAELPQIWMLLGVALGSYLLGAVNSALIISRLLRLPDPRAEGSGNPGATNMLRITHRRGVGAATLVGDVGKGALAVWLALFIVGDGGAPWPTVGMAAGVMVVVGHMWPVYYGFHGGKGVATLAGVLAVLDWVFLGVWGLVWLIGYGLSKRVSAGSVAACALLPLYAWVLYEQVIPVAVSALLGVLIVYRHKTNIIRLWHETEEKP